MRRAPSTPGTAAAIPPPLEPERGERKSGSGRCSPGASGQQRHFTHASSSERPCRAAAGWQRRVKISDRSGQVKWGWAQPLLRRQPPLPRKGKGQTEGTQREASAGRLRGCGGAGHTPTPTYRTRVGLGLMTGSGADSSHPAAEPTALSLPPRTEKEEGGEYRPPARRVRTPWHLCCVRAHRTVS